MQTDTLHHWYGPSRFVIGAGCVGELEPIAKDAEISHVLLITSQSVAADSEIINPIIDGLGSLDVTVFDEVSIKKELETVLAAVDLIESSSIDGIVSVGGGSTVDVARAVSAVAVTDDDPTTLFADVGDDGEIEFSDIPSASLPVIAIPTTLSGAEVTCAAGMNIGDPDQGSRRVRNAPMISPDLWPEAIFYDPKIAARTPDSVLGPSAMNGLDHGIEMLYSRNGSAFTDATATQGIRLFNESIPNLLGDSQNIDTLERAMTGVALSTLGLIDPTTGAKYSVIHAFGHQLAQRYDVHQGQVHGIVAPTVLDYIFDNIETNQAQLAEALGCATKKDSQTAIVNRVRELRNALSLPSELRTLDAIERNDFPELAEAIRNDIGIQFGPSGLTPTTAEIEGILDSAW
ncbi:iron-containing alcohol dehydrogenase [Natronomonas halophila]|uniref:iron-containing alcohol dehydrogenase n=1 Tax=Natronomonas halophila TaxID=2747817 RepID=UPI0015B3F657|nr:iron-containing alcohol dehydrogenase [Natronomonas halophila]QLD86145.1 iron-containing alcohol dehydrogenase [Natronomonas halophila]